MTRIMKTTNYYHLLAVPLRKLHGTLEFRGTLVAKRWSNISHQHYYFVNVTLTRRFVVCLHLIFGRFDDYRQSKRHKVIYDYMTESPHFFGVFRKAPELTNAARSAYVHEIFTTV